MAIYNNREVTIVGPNPQANSPESINIQYKDGTHENVKLSAVKFTEDEKKAFQKQYPSRYDNVETVKEEDLKAVRVGVAPTFDESAKRSAEIQAQRDQQLKLSNEQNERLKNEANKKLDQQINAPAPAPQINQVKK